MPSPPPLTRDGSLADWVVTNIDNNFNALLIAGGIGLGIAIIVALGVNTPNQSFGATLADVVEGGKEKGWIWSLAATVALLVFGLLIQHWSGFNTEAHRYAAVFLFVLLIGAILSGRWKRRTSGFPRYMTVAI